MIRSNLSPSPRPVRRFAPGLEQLETRNVLAAPAVSGSTLLTQVIVASPTAQVAIQVVQTNVFIATTTVPTATISPLDVPSAVQNIASSALAQSSGASVIRVVVIVTPQTGPFVVVLATPSPFATANAVTANEQPASPQAPTPPLSPSVVVANPLINFPRFLWVAEPPQTQQSNYLELPEEIPVMPGDANPAPPANPAPALPPLPPAIHFPLPLAQMDYSEPRVVMTAAIDGNSSERLEAPTLPPTTEENTSPSSAAAGLAVALLGFPCAVAAERQRREFFHDRRRDPWPWVW